LLIVISITAGLHFYNHQLDIKIAKLKTTSNSIEVNISEVEKDKSIKIYYLLELNKKLLNSYLKSSKITKYINHMNVIESKYDLELS
jgi:hypothetical protein